MKAIATWIKFKQLICVLLLISTTTAFAQEPTDPYQATKQGGEFPTYPQINYGTGAKAEQLKHGEYLVRLGDCIACHTKKGGAAFAGGRRIKTPFGSIFTPNLTPDKATGIGQWTEAQFIRAMQKGISPKGQFYYPAFPYLYFNRITKEDLLDIKAYLDAIPPVVQKNRDNEMMFPFNWRFLQLGWRILFFHPKPPKAARLAAETDLQKRGEYLVDGLGHCGMCHTPSHYFIFKNWLLAAPVKKYYLAGAFIEGFFAPNITKTNLKDTDVQDIADVFLKNKLIGGGQVQGPMSEANHNRLRYLKSDDIEAIALYLKNIVSKTPPLKKSKSDSVGEQIYNQYCTGCHSTGAGGAPKIGDTAAWEPLLEKGMNTLYKNAINGIGGMPAKGSCRSCTNDQIQAAVQYIAEQSKPGSASVTAQKPMGEVIKPLTIADGKQLYDKYCSVCHQGQYPNAPKTGDKVVWEPLIKQGMDVLFVNSVRGINNMPARGGCRTCNDAQILAAIKYMVQESKTKGDYQLW